MSRNARCIGGYEGLLPGIYYACRARYHYVRKHYLRTLEMLREASRWANKRAQYTLGLIFFEGTTPDVPQNRPRGIAWLALSAERGEAEFVRAYTQARLQASPAEVLEADVIYKTLREKYSDKVAAPRAKRRFTRGVRGLKAASQSGGLTYISGFSPYPETAFTLYRIIQTQADHLFEGLSGRVTIGPIQQEKGATPAATSPAPASSRP